MTDSKEWMRRGLDDDPAIPGVDFTKASIARGYDYALGGKNHYAVDRAAAEAINAAAPETAQAAQELAQMSRGLLGRGVRYLVGEAGIRQIIDIGSGLPTKGNVHQIAHELDPSVRVVYVDNDPVVLAHGRALLENNDTTTVITADLREPDGIFDHPDTREFVDTSEPFAVLLVSILHHLADDEDPEGVAASVRQRIPSGGYLLVANFHDNGDPQAKKIETGFLEGGIGTGRFRRWEEQRRYFGDLELVEPGLVPSNDWRPDADTPTESPVDGFHIGGLGRKP